jgi:hypothetical protein
MRCLGCDYPLWRLRARECPECGRPFRPGQYEFEPGRVCFCCPHCDQAYHGTDERGHLVPATFDCVDCGRRVNIDEMVLLPAPGFSEEQTQRNRVPWLERRSRGFWRCWWRTAKAALFDPARLMYAIRGDSRVGEGWWFAAVTIVTATVASFIPAIALFAVIHGLMIVGGARSMPPWFFVLFLGQLAVVAGIVCGAALLWLAIWSPLAQMVLRLTGPVAQSRRQTRLALCYASGSYVSAVVPCIGSLGVIWWIVSGVLMVRVAQRVNGFRATLAVAGPPAAAFALFMAAYLGLVFVALGTARTTVARPLIPAQQEAGTVVSALRAQMAGSEGAGPAHALELVTAGRLEPSDLVGAATLTDLPDVPVGGTTLQQFMFLGPAEKQAVVREAKEALPPGVVAHRLGDFVFTHHGIDLAAADAGLWLLVYSADPRVNPGGGAPWAWAGLADGTVAAISSTEFPARLSEQNDLRALAGLPPIPDPRTVTHERPAAAGEAP